MDDIDELEKLIKEQGFQDEYAQALVNLVCDGLRDQWAAVYESSIEINTYHGLDGPELVMRLAALTEEQRVVAAIKAIELNS